MDEVKLKRISDIINRWFCEHLDLDCLCMRTFSKLSDDGKTIVITAGYHSADWPVSTYDDESSMEDGIKKAADESMDDPIMEEGLSYAGMTVVVETMFDFSCIIKCAIKKEISISCEHYEMF